MRKRLDSYKEWKMLASCSGSLKYMSSYSESEERSSLRVALFANWFDSSPSTLSCLFRRSYSDS
jgi:hypothetical protein